jgi:formate dehydrogenase
MVKVILDAGLEHVGDCADLAGGMAEIRALAAAADLTDLAARCALPCDQIERLARDFATATGAMVITRTGVSLQEAGTVAEWLGHVLNVITGRMDRPGGRRFEPGYVDTLRLAGLAETAPHRSRVAGREMVAGAHALAELPDEILTPGAGRIRALVINAGNPVISGPDGARLDAALQQLDLLVAIDFVQRESHRHAHWLLPAVHWLEREDLLAFTSSMHDEPFVQLGVRAVEPPPQAREEWRIFVDLALAMKRPLFGARGLNGFIRFSRRAAGVTGRPALAFGPHWIDRLMIATSRKVNGRRLKWRHLRDNPHGLVLGPREFGHFRAALRTPDKKVQVAPAEFVARTRELLASAGPQANAEFPFLLGNRRNRHAMNSWLNELPGLHPAGKHNVVFVHPEDAAALGISDGDTVRVFSAVGSVAVTAAVSDRPRRGLVVMEHGWGSRVFDPRSGAPPQTYGVNRNLLVDGAALDPLSQTSALGGTHVGIERIAEATVSGAKTRASQQKT